MFWKGSQTSSTHGVRGCGEGLCGRDVVINEGSIPFSSNPRCSGSAEEKRAREGKGWRERYRDGWGRGRVGKGERERKKESERKRER